MRVGVILAGAMLLGACATTAPTEAEKSAAIQAEVDCFTKAAHAMDDGRSDAETIGRAVAAMCAPEVDAHAAIVARGLPTLYQGEAAATVSIRAPQRATQVVLLVRRGVR